MVLILAAINNQEISLKKSSFQQLMPDQSS
jgi:hypothetical protein